MSPTQFLRSSSQDAECNISEAAKGCTAEKSPDTKLSNCWCKKSLALANQLVDSLSVYPTIYKVLDIPGGAEMCVFFAKTFQRNQHKSITSWKPIFRSSLVPFAAAWFPKMFFGDKSATLKSVS